MTLTNKLLRISLFLLLSSILANSLAAVFPGKSLVPGDHFNIKIENLTKYQINSSDLQFSLLSPFETYPINIAAHSTKILAIHINNKNKLQQKLDEVSDSWLYGPPIPFSCHLGHIQLDNKKYDLNTTLKINFLRALLPIHEDTSLTLRIADGVIIGTIDIFLVRQAIPSGIFDLHLFRSISFML